MYSAIASEKVSAVNAETRGISFAVKSEYLPHIDGIRALAVIPVVLNHICVAFCPGGFAGVDVFFVISGYLITGGLLRDLRDSRYSVMEFYSRRIRRIFPAYFAVIFGVLLLGVMICYGEPLLDLTDAALSGTLFSANLFFWSGSNGYFATPVRGNPVMHLWSLSVEEQFYFFIPLLYALVWKVRRNWMVPVFVCLAVCSFAGAVWRVGHGETKDAFYLFHFRAWELLAGGILSMIPRLSPSRFRPVRETNLPIWVSVLGLALVMGTYWSLTEKSSFPGIAALGVVLGTALLISVGNAGPVGRLLTNRHMVMIGKISYSLYLIHWPVIVFWRWLTYGELFLPDLVGMAIVSLLLSWLSWRWVEQPVRKSANWSRGKAFTLVFCGTAFLAVFCATLISGRAWPEILHVSANQADGRSKAAMSKFAFLPMGRTVQRLARVADRIQILGQGWSASVGKYQSRVHQRMQVFAGRDGFCVLGAENARDGRILVIGDSHAGALKSGMAEWAEETGEHAFVWSESATDMFNLKSEKVSGLFGLLKQYPSISQVVLVEAWVNSRYQNTTGGIRDEVSEQLTDFVERLKALGIKVCIVSDVAHGPSLGGLTSDPTMCRVAARMEMFSPRYIDPQWTEFLDGQSVEAYNKGHGKINEVLESVCRKTQSLLVPLQEAFFRDGMYRFFDGRNGRRVALYQDNHHLVGAGSRRAVAFIMEHLAQKDCDRHP